MSKKTNKSQQPPRSTNANLKSGDSAPGDTTTSQESICDSESPDIPANPKYLVMRIILATAAIVVILAGVMAARSLLTPLIMSVFFSMILTPPLLWFKKKGVPDGAAIGILGFLVLVCGMIVIGIVANSANSFIGNIGKYQKQLEHYTALLENIPEKFKEMFGGEENSETAPTPENIQHDDTQEVVPLVSQIVSEAGNSSETENSPESGDSTLAGKGETGLADNAVASDGNSILGQFLTMKNVMPLAKMFSQELTNLASTTFMVVVTVIFILLEAAVITRKIDLAFGNKEPNEHLMKIGEQIWTYMVIKTWISLLTGVLTAIFLWFMGIEYALLWGLLAFLFNYIPNIGSIIASIPPILLALFDHSIGTSIGVAVGLIAINFGVGYGLEPKFLGKGLGLSSLVVLLSLIFWGWLLGPVGMFLSAPLTMIIKIISMASEETRWLGILLSDRVEKEG